MKPIFTNLLFLRLYNAYPIRTQRYILVIYTPKEQIDVQILKCKHKCEGPENKQILLLAQIPLSDRASLLVNNVSHSIRRY